MKTYAYYKLAAYSDWGQVVQGAIMRELTPSGVEATLSSVEAEIVCRNTATNSYGTCSHGTCTNGTKTNGTNNNGMVSAENVKYWKVNYQWREDRCSEYGNDTFRDVMMLGVRNDGWTKENIQDYTDFLEFLIDKFLDERCGGDVKKLANHLFLTDIFTPGGSGYINFGLTKADAFQGCTVSDMFPVRLGDLAIPPCHRTHTTSCCMAGSGWRMGKSQALRSTTRR